MKVVLVMLGGVLAVFVFVFYVKNHLVTPQRLFFYTVEVSGKDHGEVVRELIRKLNESKLRVIRVLPMSEVIHRRGVKDFPRYTTILACDIPQKKEILLKVPFMSVLIPCSVAVYEKGNVVHVTVLRDYLILRDFSGELPDEHAHILMNTYGKLRAILKEVSGG